MQLPGNENEAGNRDGKYSVVVHFHLDHFILGRSQKISREPLSSPPPPPPQMGRKSRCSCC
jgi:hypothetical protein